MFCSQCGATVESSMRFCHQCAAPIKMPIPPPAYGAPPSAYVQQPTYVQQPVYIQQPPYVQQQAYVQTPVSPKEKMLRLCRNPVLIILGVLQSIMAVILMIDFGSAIGNWDLPRSIAVDDVIFGIGLAVAFYVFLIIASILQAAGLWVIVAGGYNHSLRTAHTGCRMIETGIYLTMVSLVSLYGVLAYSVIQFLDYQFADRDSTIVTFLIFTAIFVIVIVTYGAVAAWLAKVKYNLRMVNRGGKAFQLVRPGGITAAVMCFLIIALLLVSLITADIVKALELLLILAYMAMLALMGTLALLHHNAATAIRQYTPPVEEHEE